jgi:hypothetical protein
MQIAEMRSALAADFESKNPRNGGFPKAPDWVVKRMWEHRSGLPFSPLSALPEIALRNMKAFLTRSVTKRAVAVAVDDDPTGEKEKLRIRLEALRPL